MNSPFVIKVTDNNQSAMHWFLHVENGNYSSVTGLENATVFEQLSAEAVINVAKKPMLEKYGDRYTLTAQFINFEYDMELLMDEMVAV